MNGAEKDSVKNYAIAKTSGTSDLNKLCKLICSRSTLSSADVKAVLDSLNWAMDLELSSGEVVCLRPLDQIPAHVRGYNSHSVGICYEGGLDIYEHPRDTRTKAQKISLLRLIRQLLICFPGSRVCGHRDLSEDMNGDGIISPNEWSKQCPSFDAIPEYKELVYELRKK